uniref:Histone-lysine N-methyltransferase EZH2 n=1 Tax=Lygus hesperus TaxID=30085 RepID=A0A0A9XFF1_LYGHE
MCDYFNNYLASTGNRDKVMAIVQFLPMALAGPLDQIGCQTLSLSMSNLSSMADKYRAITRLSLLLGALSRQTLTGLLKPKGDIVNERLERLGHLFHVMFCVFDNNALLAGSGVTSTTLTSLGGCAVTCWFYVLLTGIVRELYKMMNTKQSDEEHKHSCITLVKLGCFIVFAMASLPKSTPQLLTDCSCPMVLPFNSVFRVITPHRLLLSDSTRGLLGLIASTCDFF